MKRKPKVRTKPRHKHYWFHPHVIIEGRWRNEIVIVRYCRCGRREQARVRTWTKARGDYARDEHYE